MQPRVGLEAAAARRVDLERSVGRAVLAVRRATEEDRVDMAR